MQTQNTDRCPRFVKMLHAAEITQAELSRVLGITPVTVSRWHKTGLPQYAAAYLQVRAENIKLREQLIANLTANQS